jgi:hypothetical protein
MRQTVVSDVMTSTTPVLRADGSTLRSLRLPDAELYLPHRGDQGIR